MFKLLVGRLRYSPATASRRFAAMRCAVRCPFVIGMLRAHRTSLTALAKVAPVLDEADDPAALLHSIDGRSPREVEAIVVGVRPVDKPVERVKPVAVRKSSASTDWLGIFRGSSAVEQGGDRGADAAGSEKAPTAAPGASAAEGDSAPGPHVVPSEGAPAATPGASTATPPASAVEVESESEASATAAPASAPSSTAGTPAEAEIERRMALSFSLSAEDHAAFERARVFERDGHRCTFVAADGTRCTATHDLQIDHVHPFALGGTNEPHNLRVLCGAHNRRRAEETFGARRTAGASPRVPVDQPMGVAFSRA